MLWKSGAPNCSAIPGRPMDSKPRKFLTPSELCERWEGAVNEKTLSQWRSAADRLNGLPYVKIGGRVRYRIEDVEAYENRMPTEKSAKRARPSKPSKPARPPS